MRKLIVVIIALIVLARWTGTGFCDDDDAANKTCANMAKIAELTMEKRQQGADMVAMMAVIDSMDHEGWKKVSREILIEAYKEPEHMTEKYKERAVRTFKNMTYSSCLEAAKHHSK